MNVPEASFCSGCGAELGLEPVGEDAALPCPICKVALTAYRSELGALFDCAQCGGQFLEHTVLRDMLHRRELDVGLAAPHSTRGFAVADARNAYVPCPVCTSLMNRKNFGTTSGVIVDTCKKHGTWFDLGELPRVLAFVAAGGLEHERQRHVEEAERVKREARAAASVRPHPASSQDVALEYRAAGSSLAHFFVDLLLR
jgi:Zn-finger nucleic acid-binding protein